MQLNISNVGKIKEAKINIDGITVIAGENNAGKSTIGKLLFAIFHSMNDMNRKIRVERRNKIKNIVDKALRAKVLTYRAENERQLQKISIPAGKLADAIIEYLGSERTQTMEELVREQIKEWSAFTNEEDREEFIKECVYKVSALLEISDQKVMMEVVTRWFTKVFEWQISPLRDEQIASEVELVIKDKKISCHFQENACTKLQAEFDIVHPAIYVENPFVVDKMTRYSYDRAVANKVTESYLLHCICKESEDVYDGIFDSIEAKNKLDKVYDLLGKVVDGNIEMNRSGEFCYKSSQYEKPLNIINLSTGMKAFALIKQLLEKGGIREKDVLILDEPEIHLHPEWQLLYAELIVLLQREFDLSMVITTHSPYFLDAIDVFSRKYNIAEKTHYYLAENVGDVSLLRDVTDNIDAIYKKLSDPMQVLENLRYNG